MHDLKKTIVIVGAGIMGISSALNLIRRGCDVTIIEKEIDGQSASFGNASWLSSPSITPVLTPGAIFKIPKKIFIVEDIPKGATGKLQRIPPGIMAKTREQFEGGSAQAGAKKRHPEWPALLRLVDQKDPTWKL